MNNCYTVTEYENNGKRRLEVAGVSFGYGDSNPYILEDDGRFILTRHPATKEWSGRGESSSYPGSYVIYDRKAADNRHPDNPRYVRVGVVFDKAYDRKSRVPTLREAEAKLKELQEAAKFSLNDSTNYE